MTSNALKKHKQINDSNPVKPNRSQQRTKRNRVKKLQTDPQRRTKRKRVKKSQTDLIAIGEPTKSVDESGVDMNICWSTQQDDWSTSYLSHTEWECVRFEEQDTIVNSPSQFDSRHYVTVPATKACKQDEFSEWDIIVESKGYYLLEPFSGFITKNNKKGLREEGWCLVFLEGRS